MAMTDFRNTVFGALICALVAGVLITAAQQWQVLPVLFEAEGYETAEPAAEHSHADSAAHTHDDEAWAPADGIERTLATLLSNALMSFSFALLLTAAIQVSGSRAGPARGLLWGMAGFVVFFGAPALGLPPELPGQPAAELAGRQGWWWLTVVCTAAGLALAVFGPRWFWRIGAIALIALPHLLGAPPMPATPDPVPVALHQQFVVATTISNVLLWLAIGALAGWWLGRRQQTQVTA